VFPAYTGFVCQNPSGRSDSLAAAWLSDWKKAALALRWQDEGSGWFTIPAVKLGRENLEN
jgi:hypothetical protein